jgi:uncharacterized protein (TIGR00369 family)
VCFACAPDHPHGLHLKFENGEDGSASAAWRPTEHWQGYPGVIHGGIVSTVLDEAMAKAVAVAGVAWTGELRVRYKRPVAPGEDLRVRGWIVERGKRLMRAEAALIAPDGSECAHAWSVFLPPAKRKVT